MKFRWETEFKETEVGEIPRDWEVEKIEKLGRVITGKTPPTKKKIFWNGVFPFITPSDILDYDVRYDYEVERFLSEYWLLKSKQLLLPKNSSCFVCIGSTIGKMCLTKEESFTNQQINAVIPSEKNDPLFLFYNLKGNQFRIREEFGGGGAAKDIISKSKFEKVSLPLPPPQEQSRIATVLSWFDDLIENKKRQNEILEKVAMALFKNWFIDFEPFKDGEFVYKEDLGKEIPKGWEVKSIGEIAKFTNGLSYKGEEKSEEFMNGSFLFVTLNNIREGGGFKTEYSFIKSDRVKEKHFVREGDVILANTEQTKTGRLLGSPAIVIFPSDYNQSLGVYSHHITKILPVREYYKIFLYLIFKIFQQDIAQTYHTGTGVWGFDIVSFQENFLMCSPPPPILKSFHSLVEPIFQKIILNQKQIMLLRKIRDRLLPLLVFGKLRVEEI